MTFFHHFSAFQYPERGFTYSSVWPARPPLWARVREIGRIHRSDPAIAGAMRPHRADGHIAILDLHLGVSRGVDMAFPPRRIGGRTTYSLPILGVDLL